MVFAHVIGRSYEYRVRNWFKERENWEAERNPLSGASDQITEEMGKHDVRAWNDKLNIFLQIECKKTSTEQDNLKIQKEWLDKIDFSNDEFLVFSYQNCQQHFALMPKSAAQAILEKVEHKLKLKEKIYEASGEVQFGFKKEWVDGKRDEIFLVKFNDVIYYILDLGEFIDLREKYIKPESENKSLIERIKTLNTKESLEKFFKDNESKMETRDKRAYYAKLERIESGNINEADHGMIKQNQFWLPEEKKFDWGENTVKQIIERVQDWVDTNLEEEDDDIVWANNHDIDVLEKNIRKTLGLDKKEKTK
jgi:hypothetical protein